EFWCSGRVWHQKHSSETNLGTALYPESSSPWGRSKFHAGWSDVPHGMCIRASRLGKQDNFLQERRLGFHAESAGILGVHSKWSEDCPDRKHVRCASGQSLMNEGAARFTLRRRIPRQ